MLFTSRFDVPRRLTTSVHLIQDLQEDRIPDGVVLPSFSELQSIIGFPQYFEEADRYSVSTRNTTPPSASTTSKPRDTTYGSTSTTTSGSSQEKEEEQKAQASSRGEAAGSTTRAASAEGTRTASGAVRSFAEASAAGMTPLSLEPALGVHP